MKSKLIIYINEDISNILGNENYKKFKSNVRFNRNKIEIEIDAADISGLQAAVNSYINKIKIITEIKNLNI